MAQKMSSATAAADWPQLAALNTLMGSALPAMAAQGAWSPAERAALAALRQLHLAAQHSCQLASAELSHHISDMQTNKEGWIAYALDSETAVTGNLV